MYKLIFENLFFRLASTINSTFTLIIFAQCSISTIVICVSVYNLANIELFTAEFTGVMLYLCCMLTEIFILCAAGNEVTLVVQFILIHIIIQIIHIDSPIL